MDKVFLFFGASITYGAYDEKGGWVSRLREFIDKKFFNSEDGHFVYNLGISGNTTKDLLNRFENETARRIEPGNKIFIFFSIGVNDAAFLSSKNDYWVPKTEYAQNLKELIGLGKKYSQEIFFIGLTPIDDSKTSPVPWNKDIVYRNEFIREYNQLAGKVCEKEGAEFIEILEKWSGNNLGSFLSDGLHPNGEGHKKIFEIVKAYLEGRKVI